LVIIIALVIVLAIIFLPRLIESVSGATEDNRSPEQIKEDKIASDQLDDKGALGNTFDFFFGEGTFEERFRNDTPDEAEIKVTEINATDKVQVTETLPVTDTQVEKIENTDSKKNRGIGSTRFG